MPTETNINSINLFQTQADYETNKASLSENDLVAVAIGDSLIPVGTIISYAGNTTPNGFLDCSGASLSPSTYTNLFGVIGTTYGGNGSTTFNLPNMSNNLVSDVATGAIPVYGNGMTLGLTNGSLNGGLYFHISNMYEALAIQDAYGKSVGGTYGLASLGTCAVGVTTDSTKSGIVAKMTATKTTVKYCIKY